MDDITISVIVPIYKAEKYLRKCIDSIINQTYQNLEIILVDDGSPDTCPQICDEYARKDNRIKVVHQKNGGVSCARNTGINEASSEYLTFIDSDDYIELDMFESIAAVLKQQKTDLVLISEKTINLCKNINIIQSINDSDNVVWGDRKQAEKIIIGQQKNAIWAKTYRSSIIKELRFIENKYHGEDLIFNLQYLSRINLIAYIKKQLYNYVRHEESLTHERINEHTIDEFYLKDLAVEIIKNKFPIYTNLAKRRSFVARQNVLRLLYKERKKQNNLEMYNNVIDYLLNNYSEIKQYLSFKERIEYILFFYFSGGYNIYMQLIKKINYFLNK